MTKQNSLVSQVEKILAENRVFSKKVVIKKFEGGFSGAEKFIAGESFLKVADNTICPMDAALIEAEVEMYKILERLRLTGVVFPKYRGFISQGSLRILILEYLSGVSWGGPWNKKNIEYLDEALNKFHSTKLTKLDKKQITKLANYVRGGLGEKVGEKSENRLLMAAWDKKNSGFRNAKGEIYFKGNKDLPKKIIKEAARSDPNYPEKLAMQDLNFGNIGFSKSRAYLVDPVYVAVSGPCRDKTVVGVNILQQLGDEIDPKIKELVIKKFITNKAILAGIIRSYVVAAVTPVDSNRLSWQKYHQECAVVALRVLVND